MVRRKLLITIVEWLSDSSLKCADVLPVTILCKLLPAPALAIKIQCRNGEGPLAQHLFPQSPGVSVSSVQVDGIPDSKLREMADAVRQHRKKKGENLDYFLQRKASPTS